MIAHGLPLGLPADFLGTRGDILMDIVILPLIVFILVERAPWSVPSPYEDSALVRGHSSRRRHFI